MRWMVPAAFALGALCAGVAMLALGPTGIGLQWSGWERLLQRGPTSGSDAALIRALSRVRDSPESSEAWTRLADLQFERQQWTAAEHSFRTAIRLSGRTTAKLGFLLYARGNDEEALALLDQAKASGANVPMLEFTRGLLQSKRPHEPSAPPIEKREVQQPRAPEISAPEPSTPPQPVAVHPCELRISRHPNHRSFMVPAEVYNAPFPLILDTGATLTTIDRDHLERAAIPINAEQTIDVLTVAGPTVLATALLPELRIGSWTVTDVLVAVCEGCGGEDSAGLLGLDVQAALGLELDQASQTLHASSCQDG